MVVIADVTNGVFALLGVLLGSVLATVWSYVNERRERRAALYVAAYSCLTRWKKVRAAYKTKPGSVRDDVLRLGRNRPHRLSRVRPRPLRDFQTIRKQIPDAGRE